MKITCPVNEAAMLAGKVPCATAEAQTQLEHILIRPTRFPDECDVGYWHRVAHENGLRETKWLAHAMGLRSHARLRVCPCCLRAASPKWARSWQTSPIPVCSSHQTWLIDGCSKCGRPISFHTSNFLACACGEPLWKAVPDSVESEVSRAMEEYGASSEALLWLGSLSLNCLPSRPQKRASVRRVSVQRSFIIAGARVVNDWPAAFRLILGRDRHPPIAVGVPQLLKEAFPGLSRMIRDLACDHWRSRVHEALEGYVADSVTTEHPILKPSKKASELRPNRMKLAQDLSVGKRRLTRLIDTLPPEQLLVRRGRSGRRRIMVRGDHLQLFQQHLNDTISLTSVARLLGIQPSRVTALVVSGELHRKGTGFSRNEVLEFDRNLVARLTREAEGVKAVSLSNVFRKWVRVADTSAFLASVRSGDLAAWWDGAPARMGDLILDASQALAWRAPPCQTALDWLTIPKAATALKLKQEVVYGLVHKGWIKTENRPGGRRRSRTVSVEEIDLFKSRFEPLVEAAKRAGVPARRALEWATTEGFELITGPSVDASRQYFVRIRK
jgi:hypothetical protein